MKWKNNRTTVVFGTSTLFLLLMTFFYSIAGSTTISHNPKVQEFSQSPNLSNVYNGMIAISAPVQLGVIDLSLTLGQENDTLAGYINITDTLVYSGTPAVTGVLIDNGVLTPTFQLTSEPFTITVAGRDVQRTFQLSGDVLDNGVTLQGTYSETLTGLTPEPLVVVGEFILTRPEPLPSPDFPIKFIYLPIINR